MQYFVFASHTAAELSELSELSFVSSPEPSGLVDSPDASLPVFELELVESAEAVEPDAVDWVSPHEQRPRMSTTNNKGRMLTSQ